MFAQFQFFKLSKKRTLCSCALVALLLLSACGRSTTIAPVYRAGGDASRNAHLNPSLEPSRTAVPKNLSKRKAKRIIEREDFDRLSPLEQHRIAKAAQDPNNLRTNERFVKAKPMERPRWAGKKKTSKSSGYKVQSTADQPYMIAGIVTPPPLPLQKQKSAIKPANVETITDAPVPKARPAAKQVTPPRKAAPPKPAKPSASNSVTQVRLGHYQDKSRIVLDLKKSGRYSASMSADGRILRVDLKDVRWSAKASGRYSAHPLLQSYQAMNTENGSAFLMTMKKPARLMSHSLLPKNHLYGERIFLDVAPR